MRVTFTAMTEAQASDDGGINALSFYWEVQIVHNSHIHPEEFTSNLRVPPPLEFTDHGAPGTGRSVPLAGIWPGSTWPPPHPERGGRAGPGRS